MSPHARTPSNVEGPFYVEADQCIGCCAPRAEAPELIGFDEAHGGCYFAHQPTDAESTYRAISAVCVSCVRALRYGGSDPDILRRLARLELTAQCDVAVAPVRAEALTIVTFADTGEHSCPDVARKVATALASVAPYDRVTPATSLAGNDVMVFGWTWGPHRLGTNVTVQRAEDGLHRWRATLRRQDVPSIPWLGASIDDALRTLPEFTGRRWYSEGEWHGQRHWETYPL